MKTLLVAIPALLCAAVAKADNLTVEKGSPHAVSADATYGSITASDCIDVNDGVKLSTDSYSLASDADAGGSGSVDAVRIGIGSTFRSQKMNSANDAPAVISVAGVDAKLDTNGKTEWYSTWFQSGSWELVDTTGTGINLELHGSWAWGKFNADGVSVRLLSAGDVMVKAGWSNERGIWSFNRGFEFANSGKVTLTSDYLGVYSVSADGVFAPSVKGVYLYRGVYKDTPVRLSIAGGKVAEIKTLEAYDGGSVTGDGMIRMGADDSDGTLKAHIEGSALAVEKVGDGTLSVTVCTNLPVLSVKGGSVVLKASMPVGRLTIAESATVTIDGATVFLSEIDSASLSRIHCVNGGKFSVAIYRGGDEDVYLRDEMPLTDGVEFCKVGSGKAVLCSDVCSSEGFYHLKGGQVLFSKRGLKDKFLRFTFKQVLGWINGTVLQEPDYLRLKQIALFGVGGARVLDAGFSTSVVGSNAWELPEEAGGVSVPEGTTWESPNWYNDPRYLFKNSNDYPQFTTHKLADASDPNTWQEIVVRLPSATAPLDGYNFLTDSLHGLPTTWTIESSKTGLDGSWRVVADERNVQFEAAKNNRNTGWLNGFAGNGSGYVTDNVGNLAMYFNYVEPGVVANAGSGVTVQVENDSVFDASSVEGGLGVEKIVYDCTCGGGTLRHVRILPGGTLEVVNAGGERGPALEVTVEDPVTVENLKGWQVIVDGRLSPRRLKIVNGALKLIPNGLSVSVR